MNPKYFPIENETYVLAPGLRPLGFDFGNGAFDKKVFHLTREFKRYRENKIDCRKERLSKYFCKKNLSEERASELSCFLISRFVSEYPEIFSFNDQVLTCLHTKDRIIVDENYRLVSFQSEEKISPLVEDVIDALLLQVEEDVALVCREKDGGEKKDFLGLLHLCSPSHWSAEDKIGMNFFDIHAPIPGIEKINRVASKLVDTMVEKGPFVRFIWSFVTDLRLNHHPHAPEGIDEKEWKGRSFNKEQKIPFYFRIERQVTWGLPKTDSALFTIGVSFLSAQEIKDDPRKRRELLGALKSMTPESRVYKGVDGCFDELIAWLELEA